MWISDVYFSGTYPTHFFDSIDKQDKLLKIVKLCAKYGGSL